MGTLFPRGLVAKSCEQLIGLVLTTVPRRTASCLASRMSGVACRASRERFEKSRGRLRFHRLFFSSEYYFLLCLIFKITLLEIHCILANWELIVVANHNIQFLSLLFLVFQFLG